MIKRNKAVFLDRDGVINRERKDYTYRLKDFIINDGVVEALKVFRDKGYLLIVISNQSGIAKKIYTRQDVEMIHDYLRKILAENNLELAEIYYCPHHQTVSRCLCRKPDSLLLEKAMARFSIDPLQSYFIGDVERDIEAGNKAGVSTIKIEANSSLREILHLIR
jgi:D-glycero-D-manno-heptose 1,7-bisphosphate phosphatase